MRPHTPWLLAASLLVLPLIATGCGDKPSAEAKNPRPEAVEADRWKDAPATRIRFRDITATAGITATNHSGRAGLKEFLIEAVGPGAAWFDYDGDGLLDVYMPDGDVFSNYTLENVQDPATGRTRPMLRPKEPRKEVFTDRLWRNNGDGTFTDVTKKAGIHEERWSFGATPFDYDADGDQDIFVSNFGLNTFWRNNGDGTFTDVAEALGLQGDPFSWSTCAAVGDVDGDGRLDLYVGTYSDAAHEVERLRVKQNLPEGSPVESVSGRDCSWRAIPAYCGPLGLKGQHDAMYRQTEDGTFEDVTDAWGLRPRVGPRLRQPRPRRPGPGGPGPHDPGPGRPGQPCPGAHHARDRGHRLRRHPRRRRCPGGPGRPVIDHGPGAPQRRVRPAPEAPWRLPNRVRPPIGARSDR